MPTSSCGRRPARLTINDAAAYLGRNVAFMRRLVADRRISYLRVGNRLQFEVADLDSYLAGCRVEAHDDGWSR